MKDKYYITKFIVMSLYIKRINKNDTNILLNLNYLLFNDQIIYTRDYIELICQQSKGLLIYLDNEPAGYIFCDEHYNESVKKYVLTIMSMGVINKYRKLGLGRTLLKSLLEYYSDRNIYLRVREDNIIAQKLYKSEGFIIIGYIPKFYKFPIGEKNAIIMVKYQ